MHKCFLHLVTKLYLPVPSCSEYIASETNNEDSSFKVRDNRALEAGIAIFNHSHITILYFTLSVVRRDPV